MPLTRPTLSALRLLSLASVVFILAACTEPPPPWLTNVTSAELRPLRWVEGSWRAEGVDSLVFYQRYHFVNDSTISVETFEDSLMKPNPDTTFFRLEGGRFSNAGDRGPQWAAGEIKPTSITFLPMASASNTMSWTYVSPNEWNARLVTPRSLGELTREVGYHMKRLGTDVAPPTKMLFPNAPGAPLKREPEKKKPPANTTPD